MLAVILAVAAAACLAGVTYLVADWIMVSRRGGDLLYEAAKTLSADDAAQSKGGVRHIFVRYTGLRFELAAAAAFVAWFVTLFVLVWLTGSEAVAVAGSLVVGPAVLWGGLRILASNRKKKFEQQFVNMLQRLAAQLENGEGLPSAIGHVVAALPEDPAGSEFRALHRGMESGLPPDVVAKDIAERYESPAADMFYRTLVANAKTGGTSLAVTLRTVATDLADDLALRREIATEMAAAKLTAFILIGTVIAIVWGVGMSLSSYVRLMLLNPLGFIFLLFIAANVVVGVVRVFRLLGRISRGEF